MSEQIREQVSAFLDGELPNSETELLLKRLTRDTDLRESFGRYALIGECVRGGTRARLSQGFMSRVNSAIDGAAPGAAPPAVRGRFRPWSRMVAGAAVAAGVAAVAVVSFQQREAAPLRAASNAPSAITGTLTAENSAPAIVRDAVSREPVSYTVPAAVAEPPRALPAARVTNYVFAHSKYSSVMGQNDVLNDLLSNADAEDGAGDLPRDARAAP
jgi:sigma-E factor negative regulatory protein RseA